MRCSACRLLRLKFFGATAINPTEIRKLHMNTRLVLPVQYILKAHGVSQTRSWLDGGWEGGGARVSLNYEPHSGAMRNGPICSSIITIPHALVHRFTRPNPCQEDVGNLYRCQSGNISDISVRVRAPVCDGLCVCGSYRQYFWSEQIATLIYMYGYMLYIIHTHPIASQSHTYFPTYIAVLEDETHNKSYSSVLNSH